VVGEGIYDQGSREGKEKEKFEGNKMTEEVVVAGSEEGEEEQKEGKLNLD
jgi:hypothetical protein